MPDGRALSEAVTVVRDRIAAYRGQGIGEQNTKAGLIAPVLRSLGWNVEDLREVHLEYKRRPADKPVDYALLINGAPRLFVEAKALGENLEDHRWANQIMGYAVVAGVRWVVLTNGDEYRLYNSHASVPVEQKLFRQARIRDEATNPEDTLALLSKESIAELEALWAEDFVDRQVRAALEALFEPEPDDGLVRLLRRALPSEFSPRQIRAALGRLRYWPLPEPPPAAGRRERTDEPPRDEGPAYGEGTPWIKVALGDIIAAGLVQLPVELSRRYKGRELTARIEHDGRVSFDGEVYGSLSVAGSVARRSVTGIRRATNGWKFWRFRDKDGEFRYLDELRRRLWASRAGDS